MPATVRERESSSVSNAPDIMVRAWHCAATPLRTTLVGGVSNSLVPPAAELPLPIALAQLAVLARALTVGVAIQVGRVCSVRHQLPPTKWVLATDRKRIWREFATEEPAHFPPHTVMRSLTHNRPSR